MTQRKRTLLEEIEECQRTWAALLNEAERFIRAHWRILLALYTGLVILVLLVSAFI